ncbi:hypothetical protein HYH02_002812 [Chlamydomonas schloesseri]|uniref:Uncharacterized protein n=1 Tax=Chlamydomonas schloesseri TaxID=2026947 RepID=A0A835WRZ1_9CHLO|nr:hypothetical protein HYH02_002812 [Chlamydomonas schloesseri]|eukprot:KAG2452575.1 hypothetical protein HYH02_002812 [Chlamydomonas schloesseri]
MRGFLAETHHEATFNRNAIGKGVRAELVPGQQAADIRIVGAREAAIVEAQVKYYKDPAALKRALSDAQYVGMQKIGPEGAGFAKRGIASRIEAGGVSSDPLTLEASDRMTANPTAHYEALRPSLVSEAAKAGAMGLGMGAGVGAGVAAATRLVQKKGALDQEDAKVIGESAAVGAASASVGNVLGTLAQSTVVGALAAGAVGTAYAASKCPDRASAVREVAVGMTGVGASVAAVTACAAAGIVTGPAAPVVALVVGWQAGVQARKAAQSEALHENVRWGAGAAVERTKQAATAVAGAGKTAVVGGAQLATHAAVVSGQAAAQAAAAASRVAGAVAGWVSWRRQRSAGTDIDECEV